MLVFCDVQFQNFFTSHRVQYFQLVIAKAIGQGNRRSFNSTHASFNEKIVYKFSIRFFPTSLVYSSIHYGPKRLCVLLAMCVVCVLSFFYFFFVHFYYFWWCVCSLWSWSWSFGCRCRRCVCGVYASVWCASFRTLSGTIRLVFFNSVAGRLLCCIRCLYVYTLRLYARICYSSVVYIFIWP